MVTLLRGRPITAAVLGAAAIAIAVIAVLAIAGVFNHEPKQSLLEQIGTDAGYGYDPGCHVVVRSPDRTLAKEWPTATQTASIVCLGEDKFANSVLRYASFADPVSLEAAIRARPPVKRYCRFGANVVEDDDLGAVFDRLCDHRDGNILPR
jgi:hypothetical protein